MSNLLRAMAIVLGVMLVSLGIRTGLVVASLIPMSMIMSLLVMSFLDIGIDQMSLAALIIALGMLVVNAIVISESILVQIAEGKSPVKAAIDSGTELRIPLLTSSLTTAAAFLPIYLAESNTGEYTAPLFKVVTIALLSSWVLSLTMTPLMCVTFLRPKAGPAEGRYASRFYRAYRTLLLLGLRHRFVALGLAVAIFLVPLRRNASLNIGVDDSFDPKLLIKHNNSSVTNGTNQINYSYYTQNFDLTFELSGSPSALNDAIALTAFSGRIIIGSWYGEKQALIDLGGAFHRSRIQMISSQVSTIAPALSGRWDKARRCRVAWEALKRIQPQKWITHRFPITEAAQAYQLLDENPQETIQVLFEYP